MKKFLKIAIVIILIAVAGYFVWDKYKEKKSIEEINIGEFIEFMNSEEIKKAEELVINEAELIITYSAEGKKYEVTYPRNYIVENQDILNTLIDKEIKYEIVNNSKSMLGYLMDVARVMVYVLLFAFLYYFLKETMGGDFDVKEVKEEETTFKDIAGYEYVKEELQEIVDFLKDPDSFKKYTDKVPKGVLLEGPPGNGKTLFAKAVAGETETPFFQISASDIEDKYVGSGARRVEKIFKTVRERAKEGGKVILFIDEIDAVGMKRENRTVQETNQTINKLLTEMDGFEKDSNVIIIAATNLSSVLDTALTRSGRFDRIITINKPNKEEREAVIDLYLEKKKEILAEEVKEEKYSATLAEQTEGFSNADLDKLINEASLLARKKKEEKITIKTLREAFTKIVAGVATNKKVTEQDKKLVAYHEAGHLVARIITHPNGYQGVAYATMTPHGSSLGHVSTVSVDRIQRKSDIKNEIITTLAGRAVEEKILDGDYTVGAISDLEQVNELLWAYVAKYGMSESNENLFVRKIEENDEELKREVKKEREKMYAKTKEIIEKHYDLVEKVAEYLLKNTSIEQHELREIVKETSYEKREL